MKVKQKSHVYFVALAPRDQRNTVIPQSFTVTADNAGDAWDFAIERCNKMMTPSVITKFEKVE